MEFILTEHAKKRLTQRKVRTEWVRNALENPLKIESDPDDSELIHALVYVPERFKVLRVIYKESTTPHLIITAYFEEANGHET